VQRLTAHSPSARSTGAARVRSSWCGRGRGGRGTKAVRVEIQAAVVGDAGFRTRPLRVRACWADSRWRRLRDPRQNVRSDPQRPDRSFAVAQNVAAGTENRTRNRRQALGDCTDRRFGGVARGRVVVEACDVPRPAAPRRVIFSVLVRDIRRPCARQPPPRGSRAGQGVSGSVGLAGWRGMADWRCLGRLRDQMLRRCVGWM
jgi:hypothetical protein